MQKKCIDCIDMMKLKLNIVHGRKERIDNNMVYREFPEEIDKLFDIFNPYYEQIAKGNLENAPKEAIDAYEKAKKWAWEQGQ